MKSFLTFVAGIGLGVAISWVHHKNKYETMVQEEVESLRDLKSKKNDTDKMTDSDEEPKEGTDIGEIYEEHLAAKEKAKNIINYNGYAKSNNTTEDDEKPEPVVIPYVITPDDFASEVGYDTDSFYLFEDDIIANDDNNIIDDIHKMFGLTVEEIRNQLGVYEENAVYIRDEKLKMDYEILRELDTYEKRNGE